MIMIPLPFCLAALCLAVMARLWSVPSPRQGWALGFLALLAFQEVLVGTRFGYGVDELRLIQPFTAALLPPLAYLAFRRPELTMGVALHLGPMVGVCVALGLFIGALDGVLAFANLFYAGLLIWLGLRGSDGLPWANLANVRLVVGMMWFVVLVLFVSGLTDALIAYDFWRTGGNNTQSIAGVASGLGVVIIAGIGAVRHFRKQGGSVAPQADEALTEVFAKVQDVMAAERLFVDPDINLSRIARRVHLPVREVSKAINQATGQNVSQFVNDLRIAEACRLLVDGSHQITEVVFMSGFNTKSNFNRAFLRVKGMSPSQWRKEKGT